MLVIFQGNLSHHKEQVDGSVMLHLTEAPLNKQF